MSDHARKENTLPPSDDPKTEQADWKVKFRHDFNDGMDGADFNDDDLRFIKACLDQALALAPSVAAPSPSEGWQPMETAPKDGTIILVHGGIAHWYVGDDCDGEWRTLTGFDRPGRTIRWPVTHWMPMPKPPLPAPLRQE